MPKCFFMTRFLIVVLFFGIVHFTSAQSTKELYSSARNYLMQGDLDNANDSYNKLLLQDPENYDALTDYCFLLTLKKDYDKAIKLGDKLLANNNVTVQSYQTIGLAYKGMGAFADAENLYKKGLQKFSTSGVLYNEYGELFALQNKLNEAIIQWEVGIKADPNYSNNYYNATMYYSKVKEDLFWVIQYGEIFINLESYSPHTTTIKAKIFDAYKKLLSGDTLDKFANAPENTSFQKAWYTNLLSGIGAIKNGIDAESLTGLRTRFILNWYYNKQNEKTPFHLYDHQQYLIKEGFFDAYNQWIFGELSNKNYYQMWANTHEKDINFYKAFQQSKIYKQPIGEYYK